MNLMESQQALLLQIRAFLPELSPLQLVVDWLPDCKLDRLDSCHFVIALVQHGHFEESNYRAYLRIQHISFGHNNINLGAI